MGLQYFFKEINTFMQKGIKSKVTVNTFLMLQNSSNKCCYFESQEFVTGVCLPSQEYLTSSNIL